MIRVAIVEDEDAEARRIKNGVEAFFAASDIENSITRYANGMDFIAKYKQPFDIVLMDIEMPIMNGLEAAHELRKVDETAVLIFATQMGQFAINGYEVDAIGYMLKPVSQYMLTTNLQKALTIIRSRADEKIVLQTKAGVVTFSSKEVKYIEVSGHKLIYHLRDAEYEVYGKLYEEVDRLKKYNYSRCSNAFLVNLSQISTIIGNTVRLISGEEIPLSRSMKKQFLDDYIAFVSR